MASASVSRTAQPSVEPAGSSAAAAGEGVVAVVSIVVIGSLPRW
ncbi:hypothetical protein [Aquihabitans sp. G128]|nr:hypothetical protein [Aquihabitans sp. G128]